MLATRLNTEYKDKNNTMIHKYTVFITEIIPYLVMALLGGITNLIITKKDGQVYKIGFIISEIFVAMFCSLLIYLFLKEFNTSEVFLALACGITGTMSRRILSVIQHKFLNKISNQ